MKKIVGAAAALLALALGFVAVVGFGCGLHRRPHDPAQMAKFVSDRVDDMLDDLNATPEQRTRIHEVKDRLLAAGRKAHEGHDQARATMLAEWNAQQPDAAKLHALVDARLAEMRAFAHQAVDAGIEVHGILTPEQRAKVARKIERWHR